MKIRFLGTGAADWDINSPDRPADFRRYSSALVDGCLLIDPGPCVLEALKAFGIPLTDIRYVINTHRHSDHFHEETLQALQAAGAAFLPFSTGEIKTVGGYTLSAYRANHGTVTQAVHFIISDGERSLFYGLDGAWLLYDEVQAIRQQHIHLAVLDGTIGEASGDYRVFEHNDLSMVRQMKAALVPHVDRFVISHLARTLHPAHEQVRQRMAADGIEVAFDGWETTV